VVQRRLFSLRVDGKRVLLFDEKGKDQLRIELVKSREKKDEDYPYPDPYVLRST
jgi:hypothetical protein